MHTRVLLLCVTVTMTLLAPLAGAQLPDVKSCGSSAVHTYHLAGTTFVGERKNAADVHGRVVAAEDTCPADTGNPNDFDNDYDAAIGGGVFYASSTCGPAPGSSAAPQTAGYSWSPHHAFAPGSAYTADDEASAIAYTVGTDGEVIDPTTNTPIPCTGNDIVSDEAMTEPTDCGQGDTGFDGTSSDRPATIGPNTAGNTCDPADGYVTVFLHNGLVTCDGPNDACVAVYQPPTPPGIHVRVGSLNSVPTWGKITG